MYETILVPLDGSEADRAIIAHLAVLAKIHGSKVHLIRVIHAHTRDAMRHETEAAEADLRDKAGTLQSAGVPVEWTIEYGEPERVIPEKVEEIGADLIAMGTHGHGWLVDTLFGSVAKVVRHRVSVPVLMIRSK
jgi:nucleotide-binding universal stress UspA family protein